MKKGETLISTPSEFRNVRVFRRQDSLGPVYALVFKNREVPEYKGLRGNLVRVFWLFPILAYGLLGVVGLSWMLALMAITDFPAFSAEVRGMIAGEEGWWATFWGLTAPFALAYIWRSRFPVRTIRIELDFGRQEIRVLQGRRVRLRRHMMIGNFTVRPHFGAQKERADRQLNNQKAPGWKERQHCLVAWFGVAGTEPVELVCRYEWPNRDGLREIRAALIWARDHFAKKKWTEGPDAPPLAPPLE